MNEPLTKTQAHKLFGELYNKSRPPELQAKVDEIVSKYSDIFVRIKKIQEIDKQYQKSISGNKQTLSANQSINRGQKQSFSSTAKKKKISVKKVDKKSGFLEKFLKGGEIPKWGEETGTLIHGLFGINLRFSPIVAKTFDLFEEKQIIDAIKSMGFFIQKGWDSFSPEKYNIIVTTYQFFKEYINIYPLFKRQEPPSVLIQQTLKMQVLYANLLLFRNYKKMLEEDFINWLKKQKDLSGLLPNTITVMRMLARFEERRPKFTDVILSFYVLERKKLITWEELLKELNVKSPVKDRYRAPEKILKMIYHRIDKLKMEIENRMQTIKDINYIKNKYFFINERGKFNLEFLNQIVIRILKRQFGETRVNKEMVKNYISEPHRLLHVLFIDFDLNFIQFFAGTISILDTKGHTLDVAIFKPNLFKKELELYAELNQDLQEFLKQYKNAQLNFQSYYMALKSRSQDLILQNFIRIVNKTFTFFRRIVRMVRTVLENHNEAVQLEKIGKLKEGVQRTKVLPIEELIAQARFIPYAEYKIHSVGRLSDTTVRNALEELIKDFYNYMYLYRDPILLENLASIPRLQSEIELYKKKLLQYGVEF